MYYALVVISGKQIKLTKYDSPLCDVADYFRHIPFGQAFGMGHETFEYWKHIQLKHGLSVAIIETNSDGSRIRSRKDRK